MTGHCTEAFFPAFANPADEVDAVPRLLQRPFLRLFVAGPFWLAVFFLLSGYVCALKPLRLFREGRIDDGRRAIEGGAFRRVPRLVIPTTAATVLIWILNKLGAFKAAQNAGSDWLRRTVPPDEAVTGLIKNCVHRVKGRSNQKFNTWARSENRYEAIQWTLGFEMRGSMLLFIGLLATASCTPTARTVLLFSLIAYFYEAGDLLSGFLFYSGALLADVSLCIPETKKRWPIALTILALFFGSYPNEPERAAYSRFLKTVFDRYITVSGGMSQKKPLTLGETHRTIAAIASILLVISILLNASLQHLLSHRLLVFLGSVSFPLYLLHGTFMRTVLAWAYYSVHAEWQAAVIFVLWASVLLAACYVWRKTVDEFALLVSRRAEEIASGKAGISFGDFLSHRKKHLDRV